MIDGMENATSQSNTNILFGNLWIAKARTSIMTKMIIVPEKLICSKLIPFTSFQSINHFL